MDTHQAIYDAVRSKISGCDIHEAIRSAIIEAFEPTYSAIYEVQIDWQNAGQKYARPSVVFKPKISIDGNVYCVLLGKNLVEGIAGFGETLAKAMLDFDKQFQNSKAQMI